MIKTALLLFFTLAIGASAATLNSDGSDSDTQAKIYAAVNGDTVLLPASGSYNWTGHVTLTGTNYITLNLNGRTITLSGANGDIAVNAHATGNNILTNGSIVKSGTSYADYNGPVNLNDQRGKAAIIVANIAFSMTGNSLADSPFLDINAQGPGLMHHCTFDGMDEAYEFIHIYGWGSGNDTGWTNDSGATLAGSADLFYIEDCVFTGPTSGNPAWLQGYYGARTVYRYNTNNNVGYDAHGTYNGVGHRWWEIYKNTFDNEATSNQGYACNMRAGSGVIFSNIWIGARSISIGLGEEDADPYPALYQIGRGLDQTLDPAYVWDNWTSASLNACECNGAGADGDVQLNRDVYASAKPGYTPYTYPHPLASGGADTNIPAITATDAHGTNGQVFLYTITASGSPTGYGATNLPAGLTVTNATGYIGGTPTATGTNTVGLYATNLNGFGWTNISIGIEDATAGPTNWMDTNRLITWNPGVPGGVPTRTTIYSNMAGLDDTGVTDAYARVQSALNACPSNQVVFVTNGTYRFNTHLTVPTGVSIRGNGPTNTIFNCYTTNEHCIYIGAFPATAVGTAISGSPLRGTNQITVASISSPALAVGDFIGVDMLDDAVLVVTNIDQYNRTGTRALRQITQITNITSLTLGIDPPLYFDLSSSLSPEAWEVPQASSMTLQAGIEDLQIVRAGLIDNYVLVNNIKIVCAAFCWVKNITSSNTIFWHVDVDRSFRCTIRDSYFVSGVYRTGGYAYGVDVWSSSSDILVENNRFYRCRHAMVVAGGGLGSVFGYNMSVESDQGDGWLAGDLFPHGAHTSYTLYEGNCATKSQSDWTHGSSAYNTFFRNFITGTSTWYTNGGKRIVDMDDHEIYGNFVGNILGTNGSTWANLETGSTRNNSSTYIWSFGFFSDGDTTRDSTIPADTVFRHGNWDEYNAAVGWDSGYTNHTIPNSLYLTSKPAFFGAMTWPAYDSTTNGATASMTNIPAGWFYTYGTNPPTSDGGSPGTTLNVGTLKLFSP